MFWVFCSCYGGVSVLSRHCSGDVLKEWYFVLAKVAHLSIPNWHQTNRETLLLGLYARLIGQ